MTIRFVKRAPTADPSIFHPIRIGRIKRTHLLWWDEHVQPTIDAIPQRADRGWRWARHLTTARWVGMRQQVRDFSITLSHPSNDSELVIGLVIVAGRYPFLPHPTQSSALLWYCSTIPPQLLAQYFPQPIPKGLGKIAVDMAVTLSFQNNWKGRTGTHAHPHGGKKLLTFYQNTCYMQPLPLNVKLPTLGRRLFIPNDGRYYYLDEDRAGQFSQDLTYLRKKE